MQTILLNIIHPKGQQYLPVQVPANYTAAQLLQYLIQQGFLTPGKYRLSARGKALNDNQALGQYDLQHNESLQVNYAPRPVQFEGGRGKGTPIMNTLSQDVATEKPDENMQPKPSKKKSLLSWLLS